MTKILYELTFDWSNFIELLTFVIIFEFGLFQVYRQSKSPSNKQMIDPPHNTESICGKVSPKSGKNTKKVIISRILCIILVIAVPVLFGWTSVQSYLDAEQILKNNEYQTATGPVEDFHPMKKGGRDAESFVVDGVFFEYSEFDNSHGYHSTYYYDGVVVSNGQNLQIDYYIDDSGDITILRITEISTDTEGTNT